MIQAEGGDVAVKNRSYDNLLKDAIAVETGQQHHPLEIGSLRAGVDFCGIQSTEGLVYHNNNHNNNNNNNTDGGFRSAITGALFPTSFTMMSTTDGFMGGGAGNGTRAYNVHVQLQTVDLQQDYLCGYLTIDELTDQYPRLTTYFDGDIIAGLSNRHSFATHRWGADETIDAEHWRKFAPFRATMDHGESVSVRQMDDMFRIDAKQIQERKVRYLFMRWKEQFLVPDHRVRSVQGASYDGFYYIMYDLQADQLEGYYYHDSSERNQHLQLRPIGRERSSSFDFM